MTTIRDMVITSPLDADGNVAGSVRDPMVEVGRGNVTGQKIVVVPGLHEANVSNTFLDDLSLVDPTTGILPDVTLAAGIQMEIVSSHAEDKTDGTGVQSVKIHYLDDSFDEQTETVVPAGATPVNTVATDIRRVQWISAQAVGTGCVAAGNISLRNTAGSVTYEYIVAGGNQSLSARYTVPNAKTAYLLGWHCSGMKKRVEFYLRATCDRATRALIAGVFLFQDFEVCESSNSGELTALRGLKFPAQCSIKISVKADAATLAEAGGAFSLLVVDD